MSKLKDNFVKYTSPSIRIFVGLIFIISAILKLVDLNTFKSTIFAFNFFSAGISSLISFIIPLVELLLGIFLVCGLFIKFSAISLNVLIVFFSWVTFYAIRNKLDFSCGCFGSFWDLKFSWYHLIFLSIIFILNVIVIIYSKEIWSLEKIIKNKLAKSERIKVLEIIIYSLFGIGAVLIIVTLLFNLSIFSRGRSEEVSAIESQEQLNKTDDSLSVSQISVDQAYEAYRSELEYIFLDVRSLDEYEKSHIKDALFIPLSEIPNRLGEIPKDKPIIAYCNGSSCNRSEEAAKILLQNGYNKVHDMAGGGIFEWLEKGYPVIVGK
jgi:rhodanese-related sulfurtransferase/uncharacterized membrane protein YphA (DoxX/SURF4 family)